MSIAHPDVQLRLAQSPTLSLGKLLEGRWILAGQKRGDAQIHAHFRWRRIVRQYSLEGLSGKFEFTQFRSYQPQIDGGLNKTRVDLTRLHDSVGRLFQGPVHIMADTRVVVDKGSLTG